MKTYTTPVLFFIVFFTSHLSAWCGPRPNGLLDTRPSLWAFLGCEGSLTGFEAKLADLESRLSQNIRPEDLEGNLKQLAPLCQDGPDRLGLFREDVLGATHHGGILRKISGAPLAFVLAAPELYLQLAHPGSAQGVKDHSKRLQETPVARFHSTFHFIWRMLAGSFEESSHLARKLYGYHARVRGIMPVDGGTLRKGDTYSATQIEGALWIHFTHWSTLLETYDRVVRPLTIAEKNAYYQETVLYGMLLGIPRDLLPSSWQEAQTYKHFMLTSGRLTYTSEALALERHFRHMVEAQTQSSSPLSMVEFASVALAASHLPEPLRRQLQLPLGLRADFARRAWMGAATLLYRSLPNQLQTLPLFRLAEQREAGIPQSLADTLLQTLTERGPRAARRELVDLLLVMTGGSTASR